MSVGLGRLSGMPWGINAKDPETGAVALVKGIRAGNQERARTTPAARGRAQWGAGERKEARHEKFLPFSLEKPDRRHEKTCRSFPRPCRSRNQTRSGCWKGNCQNQSSSQLAGTLQKLSFRWAKNSGFAKFVKCGGESGGSRAEAGAAAASASPYAAPGMWPHRRPRGRCRQSPPGRRKAR